MSHKVDCFECYMVGMEQGESTGTKVELERILDILKMAQTAEERHRSSTYLKGLAYAIELINVSLLTSEEWQQIIKGEK